MTLLYKVFSFIINLFAILIVMGLVILVPLSLAVPPLWLPVFMFVAIVLYTWFSNKFQKVVLRQQKPVKASLRDWVRVNGFVAIASSFLNIPPVIALLRNPSGYVASMKEVMKQLPPQYEQSFKPQNITPIGIVTFVYFLVLLLHVFWTFALIKKNRHFFAITES